MPPKYSFINKKFQGYEEYFAQQKHQLLKRLTEWREQQLREIDQHVKTQERFIKDIFANKSQDVLAQREALIDKYKQLQGKDDRRIRELVDECDVLKSQLVNVQYNRQEIDYIEFALCLSNDDQDESSSSVAQAGQHHAQIGKSNAAARSTSDGAGAISRSESRNRRRQGLTNSASNQSAVLPSKPTEKSNGKNNNNADRNLTSCEYCFMLFPSNTNDTQLTKHISTHFD